MKQMHKDLFSSLLPELGISNFVLGSMDCDLEAEYNPADSKQDQYEQLLAQNTSPIIIGLPSGLLEDRAYAFAKLLINSP